ncbi:MAG TPA: HAMP domain-containing sensor histidine kinase [Accumulibacter sp.]|nr:HAMP domain-containing sensor histidine kinase [Accumulibacter sp.]HMW19277.1 HAMP domain-containing sensor histidine kinase [Accumulibacter sp.]HMX22083.1 HAMP domain-containing sensor histidine kinase [Accumulibacter sp.]HMY06157.1 HAMP domain-containing sensor histidine kinase [Accumulibacter sp.]HNC16577.1 HAMP domain-containing sensor histidine kinase [Accumulibacter sp.]
MSPWSVSGSVDLAGFSDSHWRSLRYFNLYRVALAALLLFSALLFPGTFPFLTAHQSLQHALPTGYLLITLLALFVSYHHGRHYSVQLTSNVMLDVVVLTLLIHIGGGLNSGLGTMLLAMLAAAGLVGQGRLVLFYAALATLAVLLEQSYTAFLKNDFDPTAFFQAGVFSTGCFAVAISARLLASRVIANEQLAYRRGVDLRNQIEISQRAIEEMQEGVVVLSSFGLIKQHNPRARHLLALTTAADRQLNDYSPELATAFTDWSQQAHADKVLVHVPTNGLQLQARFVLTESSERDVLIFLEDMGRVREQALQMKLAALGRLTAQIAHEIRNPLSAIRHAGELLCEERRGEMYERLLRIVLDNSQRLERIVNDILDLGHRDRIYPELIDLRETLPTFIEDCLLKEQLPADVIELQISGRAQLCFDRSHCHRMLWNLLGNALRHSQRTTGSIRVRVADARFDEHIELHVIDDGPGVDESAREHIFEPFFTTHHRGTGLGLYIVRELCEANGARLELIGTRSGADFCVLGRATGCH